jgi:hypothetical protein
MLSCASFVVSSGLVGNFVLDSPYPNSKLPLELVYFGFWFSSFIFIFWVFWGRFSYCKQTWTLISPSAWLDLVDFHVIFKC